MYKHVAMSAGANFDVFRDQPHAIVFQALDRAGQVRNLETHVMQALPPLGNKLCDPGILRGCLQQLQPTLAHGNHHQPHLLVRDGLFRRHGQAQFLVDGLRRRERLHRDSEMINLTGHCRSEGSEDPGFSALPAISSTSVYGSRLCSATSLASSATFPSPSCARAFSSIASRSISTSRSRQFSTLFCKARFSFCRKLSYSATAAANSLMPLPSLATVFTMGGVQPSLRVARDWRARISRSTRSAPSRSLLLIAKMSAISMIPALMVCTSSPMPGTRIRIVMSASRTMSTSSCPTPTVSIRITSRPEASSTVATSAVVRARPPSEPRVAMLRM